MKKIALGLLTLTASFCMTLGVTQAEEQKKQLPALSGVIASLKPVIAKVGGKEVKKDELAKVLTEIYPMLESNPQAASMNISDILKEIVGKMIDEKMLLLEMKEKKIAATEDEFQKQVNGIYTKFEGKEKFMKFLDERKIKESEFEEKVRNDIALNKLMQSEVYSKVSLTEEEAKKFYDENIDRFKAGKQVKTSHILVKYAKADGEEKRKAAMKKIKAIKKAADKKGADFAKIAEKKSEGPSASRGGDLGLVQKGQMVPAFEEAVFKMKKNEISDIVETPFGFHIIKVFDIKEASTLKFDDIKPQLIQQLKGMKAKASVQQYYKDLRKKYKSEMFI